MSAEELSGFDIAIVDALKAIIEVLDARGAASRADFAMAFNAQLKQAITAQNSDAGYVFQTLVEYCARSEAGHAIHKAGRPGPPPT